MCTNLGFVVWTETSAVYMLDNFSRVSLQKIFEQLPSSDLTHYIFSLMQFPAYITVLSSWFFCSNAVNETDTAMKVQKIPIYRIFSNIMRTLFTVLEGEKVGCVLDSRSRAGFWKNDTAAVHAVRTIKLSYLLLQGHEVVGPAMPLRMGLESAWGWPQLIAVDKQGF
jgi:hypothetical protein